MGGVFFTKHSSKLDIAIFSVLFHMNPQTYLYAYVCVCIAQTSSLLSVTLRMKSSPGGANSHFYFRWLTDVYVNNNNCGALIALLNNFLDCIPTEDGDGKFIC